MVGKGGQMSGFWGDSGRDCGQKTTETVENYGKTFLTTVGMRGYRQIHFTTLRHLAPPTPTAGYLV